MKAIETHGLTKYYGKSRGIENLELQVDQGEFFGYIGPNGAGKSTTIRTLLGLIAPTGGSARLLGMDLCQKKEILKRVGYLPSEAAFYAGMRVKEVLKLSADLRGADCSKEAAMLCERLQLDDSKKVETLSFGNRKKVGILCALQHRPELLILDEPTGGLDPLMQRELFDILQERNKQGTTVFLSSHVLSEIQRYCTRAAILRSGRLIACDRVEALASTNAKRVTVRGQVQLDGLAGIRDQKTEGGSVSFLYSGEMPQLLQRLATGRVEDLSVAEPNLEEVFLHYYQKGAEEV